MRSAIRDLEDIVISVSYTTICQTKGSLSSTVMAVECVE